MMISFNTNIVPFFRNSDVDCMAARGIKLSDANWMRDPSAKFGFPDHGNARRVFAALSRGIMPPDGAWPQDRLALYQQWMDDGFNA